MPELTRPEHQEPVQDPLAYHVEGIQLWMQTRKAHLPPPCPQDPRQCAEWWVRDMQKPFDGPRETRAALLAFLDLDQTDRNLVKAAREDNVYYRGEHPAQFAEIYEETQRMRRQPAQACKQRVSDALKAYLKRCQARTTGERHGYRS